jgi:hypothetical protein
MERGIGDSWGGRGWQIRNKKYQNTLIETKHTDDARNIQLFELEKLLCSVVGIGTYTPTHLHLLDLS